MAETVRQIPTRYGKPQYVLHPRIGSYGRRIGAALPSLLMVVLAVAVIFCRRPAGPTTAVLGLLGLVGLVASYSYLRPALVVLTAHHVLVSRWVGFQAVPRERIAQVVTVETALPPRPREGRTRGRPRLWFATAQGRCALGLDGTVWDGKSLQELARVSGVRHVNFQRATPAQISGHWPHLVPWRVRCPRVRQAVSCLALVAVLGLLGWWAFTATAS